MDHAKHRSECLAHLKLLPSWKNDAGILDKLYHSLADEEQVKLRSWDMGANILRVEHITPGVHIIVSGSVIIWKPVSVNSPKSNSGRLYICRRFAGELLGEMEAMSPGGGGALGAAFAATDAHTLHMSSDYFNSILEEHPILYKWVAKQMITKIRDTNRHFEALLMRSAEARIADDLLLQLDRMEGDTIGDGIQIPFGTQKSLSDYLDTDVASVSRVLDKWLKSGVIAKGENSITIYNQDVLQSARDK